MEKRKGKLKIFFGYCAGVGKTYMMLNTAHQKYVEGVDVVIGYIEPHDRKETMDLVHGLETIPTKQIEYKGHTFKEFDLDSALKRHPQLILVDELAHTNISGSRHEKRYSDIEELLRAGIDVYTTVNVQHLESLHDIVESITRIKVNERIPDHIFDDADDVKLVDIEVDDLLIRLEEGKIYPKNRAKRALEHFFAKDNLIALRSIALRRCADRVNLIATPHTRTFAKDHILVCLGSSPTNEKVIRTASRMAQAFHADFTALYVETDQQSHMSEKAMAQLQSNLKLARHLEADIVSTYGNDIPYQISQYVKTSSVSKLVIGRSYQKPSIFKKTTIVDRLNQLSPDLEIYIIPDARSKASAHSSLDLKSYIHFTKKETLSTISILLLTTLASYGIFTIQPNATNAILLFVLAACVIGVTTLYPIYSILAAIYSVTIINFLFIEPRFTFEMSSSQYTLIFICMIAVSFTISYFTRKLKRENILASLHAHSMDVLLETSQKLQMCNTYDDVKEEACYQLHRMLKRLIIYYPVKNKTLQEPTLYSEQHISDDLHSLYTSKEETAVAKWVLENNKNAGAATSTLPHAKGLYLAIRKKDDIFAIIGIAMQHKEELPQYEKGLLKAMLNEIALTMDSMKQQNLKNETITRIQWVESIGHDDI